MQFNKLLDSYADVITGIFYLRLPEAPLIAQKYKTLALKSSYSAEKKDTIINMINVVGAIQKEGFEAPPTLRNSITQINRIFIIATHEMIFSKIDKLPQIKNSEIIQFLRHLRNGCAHENKFYFDKRVIDSSTKKLKLPAKWREKIIDTNLQEQQVLPNFMMDGDIYNFLFDLEKHLKDKIKF
ncbi:MAG: hypothetical protein WC465_04475 [Patescibacteria group bacterium]